MKQAPRYYRFSADALHEFTSRVFQALDVPKADADLAADVLSYSDRYGIDSHGVARLDTYCDLLREGMINPKPNHRLVRDRLAAGTLDGDNGMGLVIGPKALHIAQEKATQCGSGMIAVRNSNHFGAAGYYPVKTLERDQIGWAMTNTSRGVVPHWGVERRLGTNPIAIAFPGLAEPPIVIDMSTSVVPYGKIEIAHRKGVSIPARWAITEQGQPTENPLDMMQGGALLPLGTDDEGCGHKGYCLGAMVDILSGPLSGANWGPFVPAFAIGAPTTKEKVGKGIGHFFGAWSIDAFREVEEFKRQIDHWIQTMRATKPQAGKEQVLIPGDPERWAYEERQEHGIPIIQGVLDSLKRISTATSVPVPKYEAV
ncbi:MAG: Ldh family oxidoreductase [Bacteroidota bacterium]